MVEGLEARSLLTTLIALTDHNILLTFDSASPSTIQKSTPVAGLASGELLVGIDLRLSTGALLALGNQSHLYSINPTSGVATIVSTMAFSPSLIGSGFGFDVNPVTDAARIVGDSGQNLRVDPTIGSVIHSDSLLGYATGDVHAGMAPNVVAIAHTNNVAGATTTTVYGIDSMLSTLVRLGSASGTPTAPESGQLFTVGALGLSIAGTVGFEIAGSPDASFAALTPAGGMSAGLYSVNLASGHATSLGTIGAGSLNVVGLTAVATTTTTSPTPAAPTLSMSSDSGASNTDHITNVKTPTIQGLATPNAIVQILANGTVVGQTAADPTGHYSVVIGPLSDGTYQIQAVQTVPSDTPSLPSPAMTPPLVILTVAPAAPGTPLLFPDDDTGFSNTDNFTRINVPRFFGSGIPGDVVTLFANGNSVASGTVAPFGQYGVQPSPLSDGQYQVTATQTDLAGNVSAMSATLAPALVIDNSGRPTPDQSFVGQLYADLLGRPADQQALLIWTPLVSQPNGRLTVIRGILGSNEYRLFQANMINFNITHQSPSQTTILAGASYLTNHTPQQYMAMLVGTQTYYVSAGGTNTAFIKQAYLDLLNRPVDTFGLSYGTTFLNTKGASREDYVNRLLSSPEAYTKSTVAIYRNLLHFDPDQASITASLNQYAAGGHDADLIAGIANSNTFYRVSRGSDLVLNQWIRQTYLDLLGRPVDSSAVTSITNLINSGKTTTQVVGLIQSSDEYRTKLVIDAYNSILRHGPDVPSTTVAVKQLASGGTIESIRANLFASNEYFNNIGGGTNAGFVSALYLDTLGRPIDSAGLTAVVGVLNSGTTRLQLASYLVNSVEGSQHTIQGIYLTYLRRVPSYTELSSLSALLSPTAIRDQDIVANLVGSSEYFSRL